MPRYRVNCYNCGKPVCGASAASTEDHVFCCRNCRDAYERDCEEAVDADLKDTLGWIGGGLGVAFPRMRHSPARRHRSRFLSPPLHPQHVISKESYAMLKLLSLSFSALLLVGAPAPASASAVSTVGRAIAKVFSHTADDAAKAGAKVLAHEADDAAKAGAKVLVHEGDDAAKAGGKLLANNADEAASAGAHVVSEAAAHAAPVLVRTADSALDASLAAARKSQPAVEVLRRPPIPRPPVQPAESALKTLARPGTVLAAGGAVAAGVAANNLTRGDKAQDEAIGTAIVQAAAENPAILGEVVGIRNRPKTNFYTLLGVGGCLAPILVAGAIALRLARRGAR